MEQVIATASSRRAEPWRERLAIPNYPIGEASRYAGVRPGTVRNWHHREGGPRGPLATRAPGSALSYLQLIEVAVVAACRKAGMHLAEIAEAREFAAVQLGTDYPFAREGFKLRGKELLLEMKEIVGSSGDGKLVLLHKKGRNSKGQLGWDAIIGPKLNEFDYDSELAVRWHVGGPSSPIVIDPRISFGSPAIKGTPTWLVRDRWLAGESPDYIARDLRLRVPDVTAALEFESVDIEAPQSHPWQN